MGTEFLISCLHEIQITVRMSTLLPLVTSTLNRIPRSPKSELIPTLTRIYEWFIKLYKINSQILIKRPIWYLIVHVSVRVLACACKRVRVSLRQPISARLLPMQFPLWPTGLHWSAVLQLQLRRVSKLLIYRRCCKCYNVQPGTLRTTIAVINVYIRLECWRGIEEQL